MASGSASTAASTTAAGGAGGKKTTTVAKTTKTTSGGGSGATGGGSGKGNGGGNGGGQTSKRSLNSYDHHEPHTNPAQPAAPLPSTPLPQPSSAPQLSPSSLYKRLSQYRSFTGQSYTKTRSLCLSSSRLVVVLTAKRWHTHAFPTLSLLKSAR